MTRIAIVDHGAGNLVSIARGVAESGVTADVVDTPTGLSGADGIVLPGVGSTAAAMRRVEEAGFGGPLRESRIPLLGICVGLQMFFDGSDEDGAAGLGLIAGRVVEIADAPRLPHIGWNDVRRTRPDPLFTGIPDGEPFYFVHSYAPAPDDPDVILATTQYGSRIVAAARRGHLTGVQFHPERSGPMGLRLLANFVATCREAADAA
jgi:imidazole glycerol phosphate synthase glutamine amidotransferase subunit